jgi:hypothetical protein
MKGLVLTDIVVRLAYGFLAVAAIVFVSMLLFVGFHL